MRLWFLRIKYDKLNRDEVERLRVAPILFRGIPTSECRRDLADDAVERLVEKYCASDSNRTRAHYKGSLRRFLSQAKTGDLVAIRVNQDDLLYGEFTAGAVAEVRGHPKLTD